jgi:hypothetical protein
MNKTMLIVHVDSLDTLSLPDWFEVYTQDSTLALTGNRVSITSNNGYNQIVGAIKVSLPQTEEGAHRIFVDKYTPSWEVKVK